MKFPLNINLGRFQSTIFSHYDLAVQISVDILTQKSADSKRINLLATISIQACLGVFLSLLTVFAESKNVKGAPPPAWGLFAACNS